MLKGNSLVGEGIGFPPWRLVAELAVNRVVKDINEGIKLLKYAA